MEDRYWHEKYLARTYAALDAERFRTARNGETSLQEHIAYYERKLVEAQDEDFSANIVHYETYLRLFKAAMGYRDVTLEEDGEG